MSTGRTSTTLEPQFWQALGRIAAEQGMSINEIASKVHMEKEPSRSLASALRLYVLKTYEGWLRA